VKSHLYLICALTLAACSKNFDKPAEMLPHDEQESCSFGISEFNLTKRPALNDEVAKGKPGSSTAAFPNVILLDFNGHLVSGTMWNVNGDFNCAPANLTATEIDNILQRVSADFTPFNITVTTDENIYNNANVYKRMRVVVTESWEWFGQAGGTAYLNSFTWGNNTPCFVFSSLLAYSTKKIAEACSHEAGHTLGLRHQSTYDANGVKISDYNWGQGSGQIGWAPIMGAAYNQNLSLWHYGPNSISATTMQNDLAIISNVVGYRSDDYSNSSSGAGSISTSAEGIINSSSDLDFFSLNLNKTKIISLVPANVGENNDGANLDLELKIYNNQGVLQSTVNDPAILNAGTTLSSGNYYLSVGSTGNQYTSNYGMLSKYKINVTLP